MRICISRESYPIYLSISADLPIEPSWRIPSTNFYQASRSWCLLCCPSLRPSHILSTCNSYPQYLQFISSVPVTICISCGSYPQYLWGYAVPMSYIISTCNSYPKYPWGYALPVSHILIDPVSHILSTCNSYPQYPWRYASAVSHTLSTCEGMQYPWLISSVPAIHILSTREDMRYPWVISSVPNMSHRYSGYDSWVLRRWLTGNSYLHGFCI